MSFQYFIIFIAKFIFRKISLTWNEPFNFIDTSYCSSSESFTDWPAFIPDKTWTILSVFQNKQSILDLALVIMTATCMLSVSSDTFLILIWYLSVTLHYRKVSDEYLMGIRWYRQHIGRSHRKVRFKRTINVPSK